MSKFMKSAVALMIATMMSKVLGFARELVLASSYGTSAYSDAYLVALNIPIVIFGIFGVAMGSGYIPVFFDLEKEKGTEEANKFTSNLVNILFIMCTIIAILGMIFTEPLIKIFAGGFKGETLVLATQFTKILLPGIVFIGLSYLCTSYLQVRENFSIPGLIGIPYNIIIIIFIFISLKTNITVMVFGALLAMMSQFLFQYYFVRKDGYKHRLILNIKDESIKRIAYLVAPLLIGTSVREFSVVIDRALASTLAEGSISALNYANKLNEFVMAIFVMAIASVMYPSLSKLVSDNDNEEFNKASKQGISVVLLLVAPISIGAIVLSTPIVKLLFERGSFDTYATQMTSTALVFYSLGMVAVGIRDILSRIFYSLKDTKTPMVVGLITVSLNIVLNFILIKYMKHGGLALATSISATVGTTILFIKMKEKISGFDYKGLLKEAIKIISSSIVMGVVVKIVYGLSATMLGAGFIQNACAIFISVLSGVLVYGILVLVLKVEEIRLICDLLNKKLKK